MDRIIVDSAVFESLGAEEQLNRENGHPGIEAEA